MADAAILQHDEVSTADEDPVEFCATVLKALSDDDVRLDQCRQDLRNMLAVRDEQIRASMEGESSDVDSPRRSMSSELSSQRKVLLPALSPFNSSTIHSAGNETLQKHHFMQSTLNFLPKGSRS